MQKTIYECDICQKRVICGDKDEYDKLPLQGWFIIQRPQKMDICSICAAAKGFNGLKPALPSQKS
jgi:hypothetical protein